MIESARVYTRNGIFMTRGSLSVATIRTGILSSVFFFKSPNGSSDH